MKRARKFIITAVIATIAGTGCNTEELQEFSINPQTVNEINLNFLFTPAQLSAASGGAGFKGNRYIDSRTNIGMCSMRSSTCQRGFRFHCGRQILRSSWFGH